MNIRAITVCVNYSDLFARSIDRWHIGADRLLVVTSNADKETQKLCRKNNVQYFTTDIFYANDAKFNKGAALSEAIAYMGFRNRADWLLTFDADIVPPPNWREVIEKQKPVSGNLYGSFRYWTNEKNKILSFNVAHRMPQSWVLGFFMLFHASDPAVPPGAIFDMCWPHAGVYDTVFCRRWPHERQWILPLTLLHLGNEREHWTGRGKQAELFDEFLSKRNGHEDWQRERMKNPPRLFKSKII